MKTSLTTTQSLTDHIRVSVRRDLVERDGRSNIRFLRVQVTNIKPAVRSIIEMIADTSWVSGLLAEHMKKSFLACAEPTIHKLSADLIGAIDNKAIEDVGEYVVSVIAHHIIEVEYGYVALPLAEVIKEKVSGNPGFDYHNEKDGFLLIFGEAKYKTNVNAYNSAFKQIVEFIASEKDTKEIHTLDPFLSQGAKVNLAMGVKGYSAAFSTKGKYFDGEALMDKIKKNAYFNNLMGHDELLVIAVDIHD